MAPGRSITFGCNEQIFVSKSLTAMVKSLVASTNNEFILHLFTRYKRDPVYMYPLEGIVKCIFTARNEVEGR